MTINPTPEAVLGLPLDKNDAGAETVRDYLIELLSLVWEHGEGFNGKRPFGNSSWEYELYEPMVKAGLVAGSFDKWGGLDEFDRPAADALIAEAIRSLGETR